MYVLAAFVLLAITLGAVMAVVDQALGSLNLAEPIKKIPIAGENLSVGVAILMVWLLDIRLLENYTGEMRSTWIHIVMDGLVLVGMIPVKDAVVSAISKGVGSVRV